MITDEQKQTVFDILVLPKNRNYYEVNTQLQKQIRNEIQQITNIPDKQLYDYLYRNKINFIKAIRDYIYNNKDNLFQQAENRLENINSTIAPRNKRVSNIYTNERKQIIANILLETDFIVRSFPVKRQIHKRIAQETGLTEMQIFYYIHYNRDKLFQQAENRLKNTTSPTQHRISIPQNIPQSDDQLELHNISQALEEFSESKSKIKYLSRISQELGDELSINASFSNMCDY